MYYYLLDGLPIFVWIRLDLCGSERSLGSIKGWKSGVMICFAMRFFLILFRDTLEMNGDKNMYTDCRTLSDSWFSRRTEKNNDSFVVSTSIRCNLKMVDFTCHIYRSIIPIIYMNDVKANYVISKFILSLVLLVCFSISDNNLRCIFLKVFLRVLLEKV